MDAHELRDRKRALDMAEDLKHGPQGLNLALKDFGSSNWVRIPIEEMASRGGTMSAFDREEQAIMNTLKAKIVAAIEEARERYLKLALGEEEKCRSCWGSGVMWEPGFEAVKTLGSACACQEFWSRMPEKTYPERPENESPLEDKRVQRLGERPVIDGVPAACERCRFWWCYGTFLPPYHDIGECRRGPPNKIPDEQHEGEVFGQWIDTEDDQWCGGFVRREGDLGPRCPSCGLYGHQGHGIGCTEEGEYRTNEDLLRNYNELQNNRADLLIERADLRHLLREMSQQLGCVCAEPMEGGCVTCRARRFLEKWHGGANGYDMIGDEETGA
uniref:Uncharacterized protein n=1 Tax=viral metagenome TaxID=1070528 RepID=A0A6H1ZDY9_9ZZZZ